MRRAERKYGRHQHDGHHGDCLLELGVGQRLFEAEQALECEGVALQGCERCEGCEGCEGCECLAFWAQPATSSAASEERLRRSSRPFAFCVLSASQCSLASELQGDVAGSYIRCVFGEILSSVWLRRASPEQRQSAATPLPLSTARNWSLHKALSGECPSMTASDRESE